jgi:uncharacterized protein (TIGR02186 family)
MLVKYTSKAAMLLFIVLTCFMFFSNEPARAAVTTEVSPQNIAISLLYHGTKLNIKGQSDANDDIIIKINTDSIDAHMKYKGKAAGIFWMKLGDMSFEHVPAVYLLASSQKLETLLSEDERVREGIGFESIKASAKMESSAPDMDPNRWIDEFIKFKKAEKLYKIQEGTVTKGQGGYQLDIDWPFQAGPGTYNIEVLAVRDGKVIDRAQTSLTVARAGVVAALSNLAFNQAAVYGIIAIVVAMAAGFAVGALFKKGGGAH